MAAAIGVFLWNLYMFVFGSHLQWIRYTAINQYLNQLQLVNYTHKNTFNFIRNSDTINTCCCYGICLNTFQVLSITRFSQWNNYIYVIAIFGGRYQLMIFLFTIMDILPSPTPHSLSLSISLPQTSLIETFYRYMPIDMGVYSYPCIYYVDKCGYIHMCTYRYTKYTYI